METTTSLFKTDRAALELAIKQTRVDPQRTGQVEWKLEHDGWLETATFCAYHRQMESLLLDAGDIPPCWVDDPDAALKGPNDDAWCWGAHEAARLLKQMLALGISPLSPRPAYSNRSRPQMNQNWLHVSFARTRTSGALPLKKG